LPDWFKVAFWDFHHPKTHRRVQAAFISSDISVESIPAFACLSKLAAIGLIPLRHGFSHNASLLLAVFTRHPALTPQPG
jgi:hypothetical protein